MSDTPPTVRWPLASKITAGVAGVVLIGASITGGIMATRAAERDSAIVGADAALAQLDSAERQERVASTEIIGSIDSQLTLYRDTETLPAGLKDLADAEAIASLVDARTAIVEQLLEAGIDVDDAESRADWPQALLGQRTTVVDVVAVDLEADPGVIAEATTSILANAELVQAHADKIRTTRDAVEDISAGVIAAIGDLAGTTEEPAAALLETNPKATAASREAFAATQSALEVAGGEPDEAIVSLAVNYAAAAAAVRESHAATVAAESQNVAEYVDPATGQTVSNPNYNPSAPSNPGGGSGGGGNTGDGGGGDAGGGPAEHPRAAYCASTGFAGNVACLDARPASFTTGGSYVPWESCDATPYTSHMVGWGGTSTGGPSYGFPWSATVDGPTVYYYTCLVL